MKLVIFGATGSLGQQLVEQALIQGHQVSAVARNPQTLKIQHPNLNRFVADVYDQNAVADAVKDHDAVLIALGAGIQGGVRSSGTRQVIGAMQQHGLRRLVCLSTLGAGDSDGQLNFFWKRIMFGILLRKAFADHQAQEAAVSASGLDWTIVRPAAFTDGPATGNYKQGSLSGEKPLKLKISRADVAGFMLACLSSDRYLHQSPGLSY